MIAAGRSTINTQLGFGSERNALAACGIDDCARGAEGFTGPLDAAAVPCGPEQSVHESAYRFGLAPISEEALRSVNMGDWMGKPPTSVDPHQLADWFGDIHVRPHGGETIAEFVARVGNWIDTATASVVVVASPVAQAIHAYRSGDPTTFFAVDVVPGSVTILV